MLVVVVAAAAAILPVDGSAKSIVTVVNYHNFYEKCMFRRS
jgi:hypothetical protein